MPDIKITTLEEYILSHEELEKQRTKKDFKHDNLFYFADDLIKGRLDKHKESYVLYLRGVLCGQSKDKDLLTKTALDYYKSPNISVFRVPTNRENFRELKEIEKLTEL